MSLYQKLNQSKKNEDEKKKEEEKSFFQQGIEFGQSIPRVVAEEIAGGAETLKSFPRGMVKGVKDTAKFGVEAQAAVRAYAPAVAGTVGTFFRDIGEEAMVGFTGDKDYDTDHNYGKMFTVANKKHESIRDAIAKKEIHETIDSFFAPAEKLFKARYKTRLSKPTELTGEFFTPLVPLKAIKAVVSVKRVASLSNEINKSAVNIQKAFATKYKGQNLKKVQEDALKGRVDISDRKLTVKTGRFKEKAVGTVDTELNRIDNLRLQKDRLRVDSKYWRDLYGQEGFAAFGAAMGVMGIERFFPENSQWLSPLAAIGGGVFIPPVAGLPKTFLFALFANMAEMTANQANKFGKRGTEMYFREASVNLALRANGVPLGVPLLKDIPIINKPVNALFPSSLNEKGLTREQLIAKKRQILGTSSLEYKEYERIMEHIKNMPDKQKRDELLQGLKRAYDLYEKVRINHGEGQADLFVPLVHNALQLNNLRSIQAALLGQADVNWTFSASKAFAKTMVQGDLDNIIEKQALELTQIRNRIMDLRQSAEGVPELGNFIKEVENLSRSAEADINSIKRTPKESGKNLPTALTKSKNPDAFEYNKLSEEIEDEIVDLTDGLGLTDSDIVTTKGGKNIIKSQEVSKNNGILQKTILDSSTAKARDKADKAYEEAYTNPQTKEEIIVESGTIIDRLKEEAKSRKGQPSLLNIKPSGSKLDEFATELKLAYLNRLSDREIQLLVRKFFVGGDDSVYETMLRKHMEINQITNRELALDTFNIEFPGLSSLKPLAKADGKSIKNKKAVTKKIINLFMPTDDTQDEIRKFLQKYRLTAQSDTLDTIRDSYQKGSISLRDLVRLRGQFLNKAMESTDPFDRRDNGEIVDALQAFLVDNASKTNNDALKRANAIWASNTLPLRRKFISEAQQANRRFSAEQKLLQKDLDKADEVLYEHSEGLFMDLLDPTIIQPLGKNTETKVGRTGVTNTFRSIIENYAVNDKGKIMSAKLDEIKTSVNMAIGRHLNMEYNVNINHSFTNKIDLDYIDELDNIQLSSGETISLLNPKTKALLQKIHRQKSELEVNYRKQTQASIDEALKNLRDIVGERQKGDGLSLFQNILEVSRGDSEPNALVTMEKIADTIIAQGRIQGKGLRFYGKDPVGTARDPYIKAIEDQLDKEDVARYSGVLHGESKAFQVDNMAAERRTIKYPKNVVTGIDKLLFEIEDLAKVQPKRAMAIRNALTDIFIGAYVNKAFKTNKFFTLRNPKSQTKINGEIITYSDAFTVDPIAAKQSYEFYRDFFKKLLEGTGEDKVYTIKMFDHKKEIFEEKSITGKELFQHLEELVNITPYVAKEVGKARRTLGFNLIGMAVDTALSFAHSFARQIIGARWILSKKLIEDVRVAQANTMKKFLTDPTSIELLHDGLIKGIKHPLHKKTTLEKLNPLTPVNLSVLYERMIDDEKSFLLPEGYTEQREGFTEEDIEILDPFERRKRAAGLSEINPKVREQIPQLQRQLGELGIG
jgi:hypothetical protein